MLVLFDGVCNLCQASVRFIIRRDPKARLTFASLQSEAGQALLTRFGKSPSERSSVIVIEHNHLYEKSEAALRIAGRLSGLWPLLVVFRLVPKFLRDPLYDWVARNRYRWFGRQESCLMPTPELRSRFVE